MVLVPPRADPRRPGAAPRLTAVAGGARVAVGAWRAVRRRRVRAHAGHGIAGPDPVTLVECGARDRRARTHPRLAAVAPGARVTVAARSAAGGGGGGGGAAPRGAGPRQGGPVRS